MLFWIDQENFVLRKVVPPIDPLQKALEQQTQGKVENLSLTVDLTGARLNAKLDPRLFAFDVPPDSEVVRYFIPPPARLLGKKAPQFKFVALDGKTFTPASLKNKIAVLTFWAADYPPCWQNLPNLEKFYQQYKGNDKVVFLAVSLDLAEVADKKLQEVFDQAKVHVPIVRDMGQTAEGFHFVNVTLLLGADGVVQDCEVAPDFDDPVAVTKVFADLREPGKTPCRRAGL